MKIRAYVHRMYVNISYFTHFKIVYFGVPMDKEFTLSMKTMDMETNITW